MHRVTAIALNTFRETVRERVLYNLVVFALLLMGTAILVGQISIEIEALIVVNLGLTAMTLFGLAIAVFIGVGLVYKEIDKRTLYVLLAKPVRRTEFILGKFLGLGMTLLVNLALMTVGFFAALYYVRPGFQAADVELLLAIYFIFLALLLATALALLFSCFSSPVLSAAFTVALFIAGSLAPDLALLARALRVRWLGELAWGVYYALPHFHNFNVITTVAHGNPVPLSLVGSNTAYALVYIGLVLVLSVVIFEKRNLG